MLRRFEPYLSSDYKSLKNIRKMVNKRSLLKVKKTIILIRNKFIV